MSLVPTSAHSGDGMGNLIALLVELTQTMLARRLAHCDELRAQVMEVRESSPSGSAHPPGPGGTSLNQVCVCGCVCVLSGEGSARYGNHDRRHPDQRPPPGRRDHHRPRCGGTNRDADQRAAAAAAAEGTQSQGKACFTIKAPSCPGSRCKAYIKIKLACCVCRASTRSTRRCRRLRA